MKPHRFNLRSLLVAVAFAATVFGWSSDRARLASQVESLTAEIDIRGRAIRTLEEVCARQEGQRQRFAADLKKMRLKVAQSESRAAALELIVLQQEHDAKAP